MKPIYWILVGIAFCIIILPYIVLLIYLNKTNQTLQLYPELKIVSITGPETDTASLTEAVDLSKKIIDKIYKLK